MRPFHILHLLGTSLEEGTGIARLVAMLAEGLDPEEFRLHAWFRRDQGPLVRMLEERGVETRVLDWHGGARYPAGMQRYLRGLRSARFDLVHQHNGGRLIRWVSRLAGARVVLHLHGRVLEQRGGAPVACNAQDADLVIATSKVIADWSGVDAVRVVYPGVSLPPAEPAPLGAPRATGRVLGSAGRLVPIKGLEHLIRAFAELRAQLPDLQLEIAGSGPQEAELRALVRTLGVGGGVRFLGWQVEIPYRHWDVFVMSSLEESFGMAALEAMAAGLPVVASSVGGLVELVEDGVTGILVPPADPPALSRTLASLLDDPGARRSMGAAARLRAQAFSAEVMCREMENLYRELLGLPG